MPRPTEGLAAVASALSRALAAGRPEWVTPATWTAAHGLLRRLRRDVLRAVVAGTLAEAAVTLGVSRDTLQEWRLRGWLAE